MKSLLKKTLLVSFLLTGLCCAGIFAAYTSELDVVNDFAVDTIDIELESSVANDAPYALVDGEKIPTLLDDAEIEHALTIANEGSDCFIRCKSTYAKASSDGSILVSVFDATGNVVVDPSLWHLAEDGYLYYKMVLKEGETISLVEMISNAPEWRKVIVDGEEFLESFDMHTSFVVEAVQSRNFEPDFTSASPWGDVEPEKCIYARSGVEGSGTHG